MNPSDSWPKLEADFRQLSESEGDFHATGFTGQWILSGAYGDNTAQELLHERFESLARLAGIKAGVPNRSNARDGWLNLVSEECPHLTIHRGVVINRPCLASAETCQRLERREIELETIAASDGPYGFRRDMYPRPTWLYDHPHEAVDDPDSELQYWRQHVWHGFHGLVNHFKTIIEDRKRDGDPARPDCSERIYDAVIGLSYDLAVLRANHDLDLGLRGKDAIRAFRDEEATLMPEIKSVWLASCEMLELSPDEADPLGLSVPFRRVREHLRDLLQKIATHDSIRGNQRNTIPSEAHQPFQEDATARPLGDNPFPQEFPAHAAFEEATWKAKQKIGKFKKEFLTAKLVTARDFIQSALMYRKRWFTTCALEATLIVGNEETADWYECWIDDLARFLLEDTLSGLRRQDPKANPTAAPFFSAEDLEYVENDLTRELMIMVAHYKAVAADRAVEVIARRNAAQAAAAAESVAATSEGELGPAKVKSALGRNIDRLRKECGWSFDDLAKATELDKKLILGHVNEGKAAHPKTLEAYARTFTEKMGRPITVAELES